MPKDLNVKTAGQLLKNLRKSRGLTGIELGRRSGLSQSKISKIETGFYPTLNPQEITRILNILDAPTTIRQQVSSIVTAQSPGKHNDPYSPKITAETLQIETAAKSIKIFIYNSVPAILQTMEFRAEGLKRFYGSANEPLVAKLLKDTMRRQDLLWDRNRKYHILIHQAGLYYVRGSRSVQVAQLDRLERMLGLPNIKIGIIPVEAGLPLAENGSFGLYDDNLLAKASATGDIHSKDDHEVGLHVKIFDELSRLALYDDEARALIRRAADYIE